METKELLTIFSDFLSSRKLSLTRERLELVKVICGFDDVFGVEDICRKLCAQRMPMANSTVYRNIDLLRTAGIIETAQCGNSRKRNVYRRINPRQRHYQLSCLDCESTCTLEDSRLDKAILDICRQHNISPEGLTVKIEGRRLVRDRY
ncbi:MAG: transcriptional repressor [Victivallales bacterium]|nr:transcriptional repressor [Victivallales bacterium]